MNAADCSLFSSAQNNELAEERMHKMMRIRRIAIADLFVESCFRFLISKQTNAPDREFHLSWLDYTTADCSRRCSLFNILAISFNRRGSIGAGDSVKMAPSPLSENEGMI
jgi:hypothetical protein